MSSVVLTRHGCCRRWRWRCSSVGFSNRGPTWSTFSAETPVDNWTFGFASSNLVGARAPQVVVTDRCVGQAQTELFPSSFSDSFTLRVIKGSRQNVMVSSCAHSRVCVYGGLEAMFAYTHVTVRKTKMHFFVIHSVFFPEIAVLGLVMYYLQYEHKK